MDALIVELLHRIEALERRIDFHESNQIAHDHSHGEFVMHEDLHSAVEAHLSAAAAEIEAALEAEETSQETEETNEEVNNDNEEKEEKEEKEEHKEEPIKHEEEKEEVEPSRTHPMHRRIG